MIISILSCRSSGDISIINKGYSFKPDTIKFTTNDEKKYLVIHNPHINSIKVYNDSSKLIYKSGDLYSFYKRPVINELFIFPLPTEKYKKYNVIIEKLGENLSTKWELNSEKGLQDIIILNKIILGFVLGFSSIGIVFGFCLLFLGKEKDSIYFILFLITSTFWMLNEGGYLFEYLWPYSSNFHNRIRTILSSTSIISFLLLIISHHKENFRKNLKSLKKFVLYYIGIKILFVIISFSYNFSYNLKFIYLIISNILLLCIFLYVIYLLYFKTVLIDFNIFEKISWSFFIFLVLSLSIQQFGIDLLGKLQYDIKFFYLLFLLQLIFTSISTYFKFYYKKKLIENENVNILLNQEIKISNNILQAQELERNRIGKMIHDEIGSLLATIKMSINTLKNKFNLNELKIELDNLNYLVTEVIESKYKIINDITPPDYDNFNLNDIITQRINVLKKHTLIDFEIDIKLSKSLSTKFKTILYRLIMELVTNSLKHSSCSLIILKIFDTNDKIFLTYKDNGNGFDVESAIENNKLVSLLYHVHILKGIHKIYSDHLGTKFELNFNYY